LIKMAYDRRFDGLVPNTLFTGVHDIVLQDA
jgi:hypothetical protein